MTANKKGFSGKKAVVGGLLTGGIGILAGTIGSNTVKITGLAFGKELTPGEGHNAFVVEENTYSNLKKASKQFIPSSKTGELNRIKCEFCETENFTNFTYCRHCGKALSECGERIHSEVAIPLHCCQSCKELTPGNGKFCANCKCENIPTEIKHDGKVVLGILFLGFIYFLYWLFTR